MNREELLKYNEELLEESRRLSEEYGLDADLLCSGFIA